MPGKTVLQTDDNVTTDLPVIPTLVEVNRDGIYLVAYCPVCDKSEKAKVEYAGQPRHSVASVAKIRRHLQQRHRRK